ncbi:outer membrane beta-barrel protein [Catalinimonas niigatensis]|uniref:outer membrane beta-barrel protein n=1 Tax=Catalinimonas niigatensis TaxID=1397264 RepID=UPI0026653383|nr:outer membrane beta-barrel protein [Catalinimonas niigatensis]WPP48870.1 outer membrane beta-barrel protein [Catalinimonas niigatensis]
MKSVFLIFTLILTYTLAQAQDQNQYAGAQPDLPGMLLIDYGFNILMNAPEDLEIRTIRSRSIGFHYLYTVPIGTSKFSFHPGIGISSHNYTFSDNVTLSDGDSTQILELDADDYPGIDKTKFSVHYINIPVEFRFFANEGYRGFTAALGGVVGRRLLSYSKIKFNENEYEKNKKDFNINPWRYGAHARVGFRGIMLTGQYMFSDLFVPDEGPQANTLTVGVTISLF